MNDTFENPLISRYASKEMLNNFSPDKKFTNWRKLWISLAKAQKKLGLDIKKSQIDEMSKYVSKINYTDAKAFEKKFRHDVMAHVHAFGKQAKTAAPIIHLGATSAFVGDNTDLIVQRDALKIIQTKLLYLIKNLSDLSIKYASLPMLGFTHLQPAQLTTLGKRISLWLQDFYFDYKDVKDFTDTMPFLGVKGTTGTQASFLELFNGDKKKVKDLDRLVANDFDFKEILSVSGQTYTRKIDAKIGFLLSGIAQSAIKMTNDIRILQSLKEIEEPFEKNQIGSSAMAYKRNPMRSERVSSLSKYIINATNTLPDIVSTQWFERTLDDSAARRIVIGESFLSTDAILDILINITDGLVVYKKVIHTHIMNELPFMTTENILMEAVKKGGDRQVLHEKIRLYSMEASKRIKEQGKANNLLSNIASDKSFKLSLDEIENLLNPSLYIGLSESQVKDFITKKIKPITKGLPKKRKVELKV